MDVGQIYELLQPKLNEIRNYLIRLGASPSDAGVKLDERTSQRGRYGEFNKNYQECEAKIYDSYGCHFAAL